MRFLHLLAVFLATAVCAIPSWGGGKRLSRPRQNGRCQRPQQVPFASDFNGVSFGGRYRALYLSDGSTYRYLRIRAKEGKPYLLFIHGWPSSSYDWRYQIEYFRSKGYGLIVPDLLGYGGTTKPADAVAYRTKRVAENVIEILNCEGIKTVYGISHDFGSPVLSRLAQFFPSRVASYAYIDIGYQGPGNHLDRQTLDAFNQQYQAQLGYTPFGYWYFLVSDRGAGIIDAHKDSFYSIIYIEDYTQPTGFTQDGGLEAWLTRDTIATVAPYARGQAEIVHKAIFSHGGYGPTLGWHKAEYRGYNSQDDAGVTQSQAVMQKPVLLITAARDGIGLPNVAIDGTRPYAPDLRIKSIDAGHWVQLEKSGETNAALETFFVEVMSKNPPRDDDDGDDDDEDD